MSDTTRYNIGDLVTVRLQYRSKFHADSPAAQGKTLMVHGPVAGVIPTVLTPGQVQIGPKPCDYAYDYELQPAIR